jgi:hypothetical protein
MVCTCSVWKVGAEASSTRIRVCDLARIQPSISRAELVGGSRSCSRVSLGSEFGEGKYRGSKGKRFRWSSKVAKIMRQIVGKRIDCHRVQRRSKLAQHDDQMSNKVGSFRRERDGNGSAAWTQSFEMSKVAVGDTHVARVRRGGGADGTGQRIGSNHAERNASALQRICGRGGMVRDQQKSSDPACHRYLFGTPDSSQFLCSTLPARSS